MISAVVGAGIVRHSSWRAQNPRSTRYSPHLQINPDLRRMRNLVQSTAICINGNEINESALWSVHIWHPHQRLHVRLHQVLHCANSDANANEINGSRPILCICVCVTISTILKLILTLTLTLTQNTNVTSEQSLSLCPPIDTMSIFDTNLNLYTNLYKVYIDIMCIICCSNFVLIFLFFGSKTYSVAKTEWSLDLLTFYHTVHSARRKNEKSDWTVSSCDTPVPTGQYVVYEKRKYQFTEWYLIGEEKKQK